MMILLMKVTTEYYLQVEGAYKIHKQNNQSKQISCWKKGKNMHYVCNEICGGCRRAFCHCKQDSKFKTSLSLI